MGATYTNHKWTVWGWSLPLNLIHGLREEHLAMKGRMHSVIPGSGSAHTYLGCQAAVTTQLNNIYNVESWFAAQSRGGGPLTMSQSAGQWQTLVPHPFGASLSPRDREIWRGWADHIECHNKNLLSSLPLVPVLCDLTILQQLRENTTNFKFASKQNKYINKLKNPSSAPGLLTQS